MVSPIVICDGMIRSGSTWSFNVCRLMGDLLAKRRGQAHGSAYLDRNTLDQFLVTQAYVREGPAIVKGHELGPVALDWIHTGRAKAVCTIRDPRIALPPTSSSGAPGLTPPSVASFPASNISPITRTSAAPSSSVTKK